MSGRAPLLTLVLALCAALIGLPAAAQERITDFDVVIEVHQDGDITVSETIAVVAEGAQIRRGIFRDLPRFYTQDGARLPYDYAVEAVRRNGEREPYALEREGNAFRIRIGDADVFLPHGRHVYEIRYRVANQVRYFDGYDEVYWNATGTYWTFPIESASARVVLPPGGQVVQTAGYTGPLGATGTDFRHRQEGDAHVFETTRPLGVREGLTVAVGFEKGLVDPPSAGDRRALWWRRYGSLVILGAAVPGLFAFYRWAFVRAGRDPAKGPVFPRYAPPEGHSPAAAHHIYYRGLKDHDALIATLMSLAVKDRLEIDVPDKKTTRLTPRPGASPKAPLDADDQTLEAELFAGRDRLTLRGRYDPAFTAGYRRFRSRLARLYGPPYFRWNLGYAAIALMLSALVVYLAVAAAAQWTLWHSLLVAALVAINALFLYLLPAPTRMGQDVRTEIEGFRLYMDKAEKLQLNAAEVGGEAPPPMTVERYERFLPYAIALGVEKPWTRHFERLLPEEAENYHPRWTSGRSGHGSLHAVNNAVVAGLASGVASAMPQSSSSSGSGGGGSSGGGGGGGGGGGW